MKTWVFPTLLCLSIIFAGCQHGFDEIFQDDSAEGLYIPLTSMEGGIPDNVLNSLDFQSLVASYFFEHGPKEVAESAFVINNPSDFPWPGIDFDKYSLVIVRWGRDFGHVTYLKDQRIKSDKGLKLYLHLCAIDGALQEQSGIGCHYCGALYPKLPNEPIAVVRWNDY